MLFRRDCVISISCIIIPSYLRCCLEFQFLQVLSLCVQVDDFLLVETVKIYVVQNASLEQRNAETRLFVELHLSLHLELFFSVGERNEVEGVDWKIFAELNFHNALENGIAAEVLLECFEIFNTIFCSICAVVLVNHLPSLLFGKALFQLLVGDGTLLFNHFLLAFLNKSLQ